VELLYQKVRGLFFDLDEEGNITIVDVYRKPPEPTLKRSPKNSTTVSKKNTLLFSGL